MKIKLLALVFVLALALRTVSLSTRPIGFTQDEAAIGYDSFSLLLTGRDMWGTPWPINLRSFGDFKLPLYSYLAIPSVSALGLNELAVRLPSAIFGSFAVLATYFAVNQLSGRKKLALFSAFFLAVSPWHISLSRGAFEANLTSFFMPLAIGAFYLGLKKPRWMIVSAIALGLNLFSYHSARYFVPMLLMAVVLLNRKEVARIFTRTRSNKERVEYSFAAVVLAVFVLTVGISFFMGGGSRATDIAIFNPTDNWAAVADRRYEAVGQGLPDVASRVFSNKVGYSIKIFANNYINYLSPTFLFVQGAGERSYGMISGRGVLYLIEVPLLLASLFAIFKYKKYSYMYIIVLWLILAPIPAALTKGAGFTANRAAVMIPALQVLSAFGLYYLVDWSKKFGIQKIVQNFFVISFMISLVFFLEDYYYHAPLNGASAMQYGTREMVEKTALYTGYDTVVLSKSLSVPHIWIMFYEQVDPTIVQTESASWLRYESEGKVSVDQLDKYSLAKYIFASEDYIRDNENNLGKVLFIAKPREQLKKFKVIDTVSFPDGKPAYLIMSNSQ